MVDAVDDERKISRGDGVAVVPYRFRLVTGSTAMRSSPPLARSKSTPTAMSASRHPGLFVV
jgi:hypothetical protein